MSSSLPLPPRRILVTHASSDAFAPHTRTLLGRIGYSLLSEAEFAETGRGRAGHLPDLRLVDDRRLEEVPDQGRSVPMLVLTGKGGATGADPRIAGAIKRPAGLHETYRLLQQVLEDTPRTAPRLPTHLTAHCERGEEEWQGTLLSISENGCLLRSPEPLPLGLRLRLRFLLPSTGPIVTDAETCYQLLPDTGMVFEGLSSVQRRAIAAYVEQRLADG